ncbi:MAG: hypothetical protein K0S38_423 [Candidatus Paceibacter sp.]|nr:hypothetical protein [Candidatus Paceibacter sp.]
MKKFHDFSMKVLLSSFKHLALHWSSDFRADNRKRITIRRESIGVGKLKHPVHLHDAQPHESEPLLTTIDIDAAIQYLENRRLGIFKIPDHSHGEILPAFVTSLLSVNDLKMSISNFGKLRHNVLLGRCRVWVQWLRPNTASDRFPQFPLSAILGQHLIL